MSNRPFVHFSKRKVSVLVRWCAFFINLQGEIVDSYCNDVYSKRPIEFYEKFKDYTPASKLLSTYLWKNIVEQRAKQLADEITG